MENTIKVAVFFVVPADILQMHEASAFDFLSHFLKARKRIAGGGRSRLKPPLDGKAQAAHLRKDLQPGQQEPARGEDELRERRCHQAASPRGTRSRRFPGCPDRKSSGF